MTKLLGMKIWPDGIPVREVGASRHRGTICVVSGPLG
eukprot:CAMPEP_0185735286 /NCGR_PEP_ID=MMETSP1171-20130828/24797_1 /TAXON_ID=374046 /ORGANISM="Helicotheca tamensis, Strain CCMP826" /LENGTH=36 /DNA_ID= /DNA_START= /DNA_END= /DNA_ORIENTATION=